MLPKMYEAGKMRQYETTEMEVFVPHFGLDELENVRDEHGEGLTNHDIK